MAATAVLTVVGVVAVGAPLWNPELQGPLVTVAAPLESTVGAPRPSEQLGTLDCKEESNETHWLETGLDKPF